MNIRVELYHRPKLPHIGIASILFLTLFRGLPIAIGQIPYEGNSIADYGLEEYDPCFKGSNCVVEGL